MNLEDNVNEGIVELKYRGFLPDCDVTSFLHSLQHHFGTPSISDELVVFFKYKEDVRLRFNKNGLYYTLKSGHDKLDDTKIKEERIADIDLNQAENFVHILFHGGCEKGLFSYSTRYDFTTPRGVFSLKFDSVCGDYWEFNKKLSTDNDIAQNERDMQKTLEELQLKSWSVEEYDQHRKACWLEVSPEPLITESGFLNPKIRTIIAKYINRPARSLKGGDLTLGKRLSQVSNDYSDLEKSFENQTNHALLSEQPMPYSNDFSINGSVLIPVYNGVEQLELCLRSIANQDLTESQFKRIEVVVVDDGSQVRGMDVLEDYLSKIIENKGIQFYLIRSYKNSGRSRARNIGLQRCSGDVIIFLDSDVLLDRDYIRETMVRHQCLENIALVTFKENIDINDKRVISDDPFDLIRKPDIYKDFRFSKMVHQGWLGLHPVKEERVVNCVKETDYFKDFGMGRVVGPFDLPCMFVTHSASVKLREVERTGGFSSEFRGWGYEDTCFGAFLIANGNYIVPLLSTGVFHLELPFEGEKERKYSEMTRNFETYKRILESPY